MKYTFLSIVFVALCFTLGCQSSNSVSESEDHSGKEIRHGWTVFSGPKRTVVGVNDEASISRGKALYSQYCAKCHGPDGKGDGPFAKEKKIKPVNLRTFGKKLPNYYIVMQINKGTGEMPQWSDTLSSRESWDLSNYIRSLK